MFVIFALVFRDKRLYCVNSCFVEALSSLRLVGVKMLSQDAHLSFLAVHDIIWIVMKLVHLNLQEVRWLLVLENLRSRMGLYVAVSSGWICGDRCVTSWMHSSWICVCSLIVFMRSYRQFVACSASLLFWSWFDYHLPRTGCQRWFAAALCLSIG